MLGLVFMFFPYFIYITHFTKFTRGSFLLKEKSLLVEKSKAEESPWLKKKQQQQAQRRRLDFDQRSRRKSKICHT